MFFNQRKIISEATSHLFEQIQCGKRRSIAGFACGSAQGISQFGTLHGFACEIRFEKACGIYDAAAAVFVAQTLHAQ